MPKSIGPLHRFCPPRGVFRWGAVLPCLMLLPGLAGAALAQERGGLRDLGLDLDPRLPTGVLQLEPSLHLEGVMPGELLAGRGARAIAASSWRPDLPAAGLFDLETRISRSVPSVWRMYVEDLGAAAELSVRCEIAADDGQANALSHAADPRSVIHVWARALAPQVVRRTAADGALIEGGVVLDLDLRGVRTAGPHAGTLTVTVEHF